MFLTREKKKRETGAFLQHAKNPHIIHTTNVYYSMGLDRENGEELHNVEDKRRIFIRVKDYVETQNFHIQHLCRSKVLQNVL